MKTLPSFFAMFISLFSLCHCHPAEAEVPPSHAEPQTELGSALDSSFVQAMNERDVRCESTGRFNLSEGRDCLYMEVECSDGSTKTLQAPRLTEKPNIFRIPFELAVVSIMEGKDGAPVLHLHYYNSEADDVQKIVRLRPDDEGEYTYSFQSLVNDKISPKALGRQL